MNYDKDLVVILAPTLSVVYLPTSAFYAQLRNVNFLRSEFQTWEANALSGGTGIEVIQQRRCAETLRTCVRTAITYGQDALRELRNHTDDVAHTVSLPSRGYSPKEREILGLDVDD